MWTTRNRVPGKTLSRKTETKIMLANACECGSGFWPHISTLLFVTRTNKMAGLFSLPFSRHCALLSYLRLTRVSHIAQPGLKLKIPVSASVSWYANLPDKCLFFPFCVKYRATLPSCLLYSQPCKAKRTFQQKSLVYTLPFLQCLCMTSALI